MTRITQRPDGHPGAPHESGTLIDDAADVPDQGTFTTGPAEDAWLDRIEERPETDTLRQRLGVSFGLPFEWARRTWNFVSTTPGTMMSIVVLLTLAIFAAGYAMSQSSAHRQDSLDILVNSTEPMSNASHILYTSLSQADTVATTSFVESGTESPAGRREYFAAMDRAVVAANQVMANGAESNFEDTQLIETLVTDIQRDMPVYAGMVENARANNRMGNPVGATYMSEASALMRDQLLPKASQLFDITREQVATEQQRLTFPQLVPISGLIAAIFFLLLAQWWLARVTHRRLNRGFVVATGCMVVALAWVLVSNYGTWLAGTRGFEEAAQPWDELTTSRIAAQESRTDETLMLVRRQNLGDTSANFDETYQEVAQALDNAAGQDNAHLISAARTSLDDWRHAHGALASAMNTGQYDEAVNILTARSVPTGKAPTAAMSFERLDATLAQLISDSRDSMRSYINEGLAATNLVSAAVMILSLISILAIWLGIRPRVQEYM